MITEEGLKKREKNRNTIHIVLALFGFLSAFLWYKYYETGDKGVIGVAIYPTIFFVEILWKYYMFFVVKADSGGQMPWYGSPLLIMVPFLAVCFWYMFS